MSETSNNMTHEELELAEAETVAWLEDETDSEDEIPLKYDNRGIVSNLNSNQQFVAQDPEIQSFGFQKSQD